MYIEANMEEIERQKFNRELNISWVDENLPKADNAIILKHYFSSLVVYGIVLLFIWFIILIVGVAKINPTTYN